MATHIVFNVFIPNVNVAGIRHQRPKFDSWFVTTAERFGSISLVTEDLSRLWSDDTGSLRGDDAHGYRVTVPNDRSADFFQYMRRSAVTFGQHSLFLERAGEAETIWAAESSSV